MTFGADTRQIRAARHFVADSLRALAGVDDCDEAQVATTELVANAMAAGADEVTVEVRPTVGGIRVSVVDHAEGVPVRRRPDPLDERGGRGLQLVEALVDSWGVEPRASGKAVWFELVLGPPRANGSHRG